VDGRLLGVETNLETTMYDMGEIKKFMRFSRIMFTTMFLIVLVTFLMVLVKYEQINISLCVCVVCLCFSYYAAVSLFTHSSVFYLGCVAAALLVSIVLSLFFPVIIVYGHVLLLDQVVLYLICFCFCVCTSCAFFNIFSFLQKLHNCISLLF
jgi:hypothetical protein